MAFVAFHIIVLAQQLEVGLVVIELCRLPVFFAVAACAVSSQLASMCFFVILLVAGNTSLGRVFVLALNVAFIAFHIKVLTQQLEICLAVVEICRLPIFLDVTLGTVGSQAAFMLVIFFVAVIANRRGFSEFFAFDMTVFTLYLFIKMAAL